MTTPYFPPNFSNFASISPKVRETLNRPGRTLNGPSMIYYYGASAPIEIVYIV